MRKIHELNNDFNNKGYLQFSIEKYFSELDEFYDDFLGINDSEWSFIIKNKSNPMDYFINKHSNLEIEQEREKAMQEYHQGNFCYSFRRVTDNQQGKEVSSFLAIKAFLDSKKFKSFLSEITKKSINTLSLCYLSWFDLGDFLTTHCDSGSCINIVINFTKGWESNHGGLTFILDKQKENIIEVLVPTYLSTLIIDTGEKSIPHFVSMVNSVGVRGTKRMAVVARYDA
ncbi:TPA: hypothetical protein ACS72K_003034 [Providencia alcalifaciens]